MQMKGVLGSSRLGSDLMEGAPVESSGDKLPFTVGQLFGGRYRVLEVVARGASGWVLKARDESTERAVALKILDPNLLRGGGERTHFLSVATRCGAIHHPNVARVYESGAEKQLAFYVMPYLEGLTPSGE